MKADSPRRLSAGALSFRMMMMEKTLKKLLEVLLPVNLLLLIMSFQTLLLMTFLDLVIPQIQQVQQALPSLHSKQQPI